MKYTPLLLLLAALGCRNLNPAPAEHSIYYWKTSFGTDTSITGFIKKENINHIYIHYFDVVMDRGSDMPVPAAEILDPENGIPYIANEFTPVVFIANDCFKNTPMSWKEMLPKKINDKINYITNQLKKSAAQLPVLAKEIQIDCDWTPTTKESYFKFLTAFKALNPGIIISATIRLYPYKYRGKMGIPPVDKGLLMCYNLSPITEPGNSNSIFSIKELKQYLSAPAYPLPLDVALPIFGWYAWFRNEKFAGIIYPDKDEAIPSAKDSPAMQKIGGNLYRIKQDTVAGNHYLRPNDLLRVEYPDEQELWEAYELLNKKIPSIKRFAFYHFDQALIHRYEAIIHKIYNQQ